MKNQKGFTLVELLAVIVILALIMGIAAFSMQGVTENVKISSMKSSAIALVSGVRNELLSAMNLDAGYYYIGESLLDKETQSPWGGSYNFSGSNTSIITESSSALSCTTTSGSFVRISNGTNGNLIYAICLHDDLGNFVYANESVLLNNNSNKSDYYLKTDASQVYITSQGKVSATAS